MKHLLLLTALLLLTSQALPCSCIGPQKINNKQYKSYQIIASGTVEKIEEKEGYKIIYFKVETAYKGTSDENLIEIRTAMDGGMCGISANAGDKWLMYAYQTEYGAFTDLCTRSRNMERDYNQKMIRKDLKFLKRKRKRNPMFSGS